MILGAAGLLLLQVLPSFSKTYEVADGVYSFTKNNAYLSMFVVTGSGVIVTDPSNMEHSKQMLKEIKEITNKPVKWVFYSHNHWDHIAGGQVFKDVGATIIAHKEAYDWLKSNPGKDVVLPDYLWWGNEKSLTLGGKTLELHYFGSSHGLGMTAFVLPNERVAYIADNVTPNRVGFAFLPDFDIEGWKYTLGKYLALDFDKAIYAHNANPEPVEGGDKEDVILERQYIQDIQDGISAELKKGTNPNAIASTLKLPKYEKWAMYKEWLGLNIFAVLLQNNMGPFARKAKKSDYNQNHQYHHHHHV